MTRLSFKPQQITKRLISDLPERARDVIVKRFGLMDDEEAMTLEAIGNIYGITRERVRQIENHSLKKLADSEILEEHGQELAELRSLIHDLGVVVPEDELLSYVTPKRGVQNHIYLLLRLGEPFQYEKENQHLKHRWHVDRAVSNAVHDALTKIHRELKAEDLITEREILDRFLSNLDRSVVPEQHILDEDVLRRWLKLSKQIDRNPLGEWGLITSPNVKVKGIRDYAYLVIRQHGSPLHFTEVTKKIRELFDKRAHVATTHNELIKDGRFVLVGRGLYALRDWGYAQGVVKDVIKQILETEGALSRDEIIDKVLKERYVKPNTILVNLQDTGLFTRDDQGRYRLA